MNTEIKPVGEVGIRRKEAESFDSDKNQTIGNWAL